MDSILTFRFTLKTVAQPYPVILTFLACNILLMLSSQIMAIHLGLTYWALPVKVSILQITALDTHFGRIIRYK